MHWVCFVLRTLQPMATALQAMPYQLMPTGPNLIAVGGEDTIRTMINAFLDAWELQTNADRGWFYWIHPPSGSGSAPLTFDVLFDELRQRAEALNDQLPYNLTLPANMRSPGSGSGGIPQLAFLEPEREAFESDRRGYVSLFLRR